MLNITKQVSPITLDIASDTYLDNADMAIDDFIVTIYHLTGSVGLDIREVFYKKYIQKLAETMKYHSANLFSFKRTFLDKVITTSKGINNNRFSFLECVSVNEVNNKNMKFYQSDNFTIQDAKSTGAKLNKTESVSTREAKVSRVGVHKFDALTSKDNQWKYDRVPKIENLAVDSKNAKTYRVSKADGLKSLDAHRKKLNILKNETLLNGSLMRSQTFFDRFIMEKLKALETQNKAVYKRLSESALLKDAKRANYDKNMYEYSKIGETYTRTWIADRAYKEQANVKAAIVKKSNIRNFEKVTYKAIRVLPNPRGVLSDIFVRENEMDLSDFEQIAERPAGYNSFSPFRVGDYEYKDALYRIRIDKTGGTANPLIYDYKIHVDIDDVKDRGTIDIPAEETKVYFNRNYYIDPDVVVNVISGEEGTVIIPYIIATDGKDEKGRYFTVVLKDAKGNPVAGTISWNSNGY